MEDSDVNTVAKHPPKDDQIIPNGPETRERRTAVVGQYFDHNTLVGVYFAARYLSLFTSYFLLVICILYAISTLITLETTNFFCPSYTEEQVRNYNLKQGNKNGANRYSCWRINTSTLNFEAIYSLDVDLYNAYINGNDISVSAVIQCIIYSSISLFLFLVCIYHTFFIVIDTYYILLSFVQNLQKRKSQNDNGDESNNSGNSYNLQMTSNPRIGNILNKHNQRFAIKQLQIEKNISKRNSNLNKCEKICYCRFDCSLAIKIEKYLRYYIFQHYFTDSKWYTCIYYLCM